MMALVRPAARDILAQYLCGERFEGQCFLQMAGG